MDWRTDKGFAMQKKNILMLKKILWAVREANLQFVHLQNNSTNLCFFLDRVNQKIQKLMGIAAVTDFIEFLHFYYVSYLFLNLFLSQNVFVIPADF